MDNTLCKRILVHAGFSIENWGIPGTPEFAKNKSAYNHWYYTTHPEKWKPEDELKGDGIQKKKKWKPEDELHEKEDEIQKKLEEYLNSESERLINMGGETMTRAASNIGPMASKYLEEHKEEITKAAVDSLEQTASSSISVGKAILSEMFTRSKNRLNEKVSSITSSIKSAANKVADGFDRLIGKIKSIF